MHNSLIGWVSSSISLAPHFGQWLVSYTLLRHTTAILFLLLLIVSFLSQIAALSGFRFHRVIFYLATPKARRRSNLTVQRACYCFQPWGGADRRRWDRGSPCQKLDRLLTCTENPTSPANAQFPRFQNLPVTCSPPILGWFFQNPIKSNKVGSAVILQKKKPTRLSKDFPICRTIVNRQECC